MKSLFFLLLIPCCLPARDISSSTEAARWQREARRVTIIRDIWGIPHIEGRSDADAVFGLLYAECEDDFPRVEMNYIEKLGRTAEVKGETALATDLYTRMVIDSAEAIADYHRAPAWLRTLLNAYADGINYFLSTHPAVTPMLLTHFEPWYPLLWTDGSIDAISTGTVTPRDVRSFYLPEIKSFGAVTDEPLEEHLTGSNGFAVAPSRTRSGHAILYINPHVTFYFRPEVHVTSGEGLDVYGAVTWGQFFVYQGFNRHCGWMHTSSAVDVSDMYREHVTQKSGQYFYTYDKSERPVRTRTIVLHYRSGDSLKTKTVETFSTHHGPVMTERDGDWISVRSFNRSMTSLIQSWSRTKSTGYASFKKTMELRANTSNNTVFADDHGTIAYWHGDFVPRRDTSYNWEEPVDGTTPATEWKGLHWLDELVHVVNPSSGWIQNCNSTPFSVSGESSPKRSAYPAYMAPDGENFRAINAIRLLSREHQFTLETMIAAGYDRTLTGFELLVPALTRAFDRNVKTTDTLYARLHAAVDTLKRWNFQCGEQSFATTLAVEWGKQLLPSIPTIRIPGRAVDQVEQLRKFDATGSSSDLLRALSRAVDTLRDRYGRWEMPWGAINRYQRLANDVTTDRFDDNRPSLPVGFASGTWGMLASYNSRPAVHTKKRYGYSGSSFVCAVEFGKKIRAKSLLTGGESGDPQSKHFTDQALMYTKGQFKDVLFYKEDVLRHAERTYHPGEERPH